jgi:hypothetical protein
MDYPGKVITKTQVTPTQTSASGNWTLDDQAAAIKNNNWPVALVPNPISKSLRFNSADSAWLYRSLATSGNRRTWTWSGWVKGFTTGNALFGASGSSGGQGAFYFASSSFVVYEYAVETGSETFNLKTTAVYRDPSAWYHFVVAFDTTQATSSNRIKIYVNGVQVTALTTANYPSLNFEGYNINNSAKRALIGTENYSGSGTMNGYMTEINFIDGQALTPSSFGMTNPQTGQWISLKYTGTYGTNGFYLNFKDATSTTTLGYDYSGNANNWTTNNFSVGSISSKVLEIVDATKSGSVTLSATVVGSGTVNLTAFGGCGNISGSVFTGIGSLNGLISDWQTHTVYKNGSSLFTVQGGAVNNNSGTQTATQSRTAQTVTQTISVVNGDVISIAFGANNAVTAYYGYPGGAPSLTIAASSGAFIADGSANDSLTDVPTPWFAYNTTGDVGGVIRGNYATYNSAGSAPSVTLSNGNLDASHGAFSSTTGAASTFGVSSGKWYWEVTINAISSGAPYIGIVRSDQLYPFTTLFANNTQGYAYRSTGVKRNNSTDTSYGASYTSGDVIGVALDMDAGTIVFYKNNTSQGTAFSSLSGTFIPIDANGTSGGTYTSTINFGQRPFAYTPPTGFRSLCTTNLPATAIGFGLTNQGDDYFNAVLYTGDGTANRSVTGVGFQPDLVWAKARSAAYYNGLFDNLRSGRALYSNATDAEDTTEVVAFGSDGFTTPNKTSDFINTNSATYVAWNWKAGGTGVSNTAGTITSTVSANTTAGFSVATYTGTGANATVGHGLGAALNMIILKRTNSTNSWQVYHSNANASPASGGLFLNTTDAFTTLSTTWNNTVPTSTVFSIGTAAGTNASGGTYVAYCFAAVPGYSAFGSYTGNGSADGPFVFCGFRPRYIMRKRTDSTSSWIAQDSARPGYNATTPYTSVLYPNASDAELSYNEIDILSNGFKIRATDTFGNASGGTYIYAAFAEFPFQFANAR